MAATASAQQKRLTLDDKRRELDKLLDDHFLIWDGFARKADQTDDRRSGVLVVDAGGGVDAGVAVGTGAGGADAVGGGVGSAGVGSVM
jgi:hypothetical protein